MSAFTTDGYRVASEDELTTYEANLCAICNGERRQSAAFEATCAFVETVLAGFVCRPCAIADWAESMLEGRVPVDLMEPEDRTLTHQQLNLSTTACWILLGRMPAVEFKIVVEYFDTALTSPGIPWRLSCGTCGRAYVNGDCICRFCNCCSQHWVSTRLDGDDEDGRPRENCPECVGFRGDGVPTVIVAVVS